MSEEIRNRARALVESLTPIENEDKDDDLDKQDADVAKLVADAFLKWEAEHPGESGNMRVERHDDGRMTVTITPKD